MQLTFFSFITDMNEPMDMNNVGAYNENGFKAEGVIGNCFVFQL